MKLLLVSALLALFMACDMPTEPPAKLPRMPDEFTPVVITGRIIDTRGSAGVQGALVRVPEAAVSASTDEVGRYVMTLPARFRGRVVPLKVLAIGFGPRNQMIAIANEAVTVDVVMTVSAVVIHCEMMVR